MRGRQTFEPGVDVREIDLDQEDFTFRWERLSEARAEEIAADVLSRTPERPSLSGRGMTSPSLTIRLPRQESERLERVASQQGRRTSDVVREALDDYLNTHAG